MVRSFMLRPERESANGQLMRFLSRPVEGCETVFWEVLGCLGETVQRLIYRFPNMTPIGIKFDPCYLNLRSEPTC